MNSGRPSSPTLLCIMDGFGLNPNPVGNAVESARTPTLDKLFATAPHSTLVTFGERVGLPAGQMGNSEVGHMNIGAGRVMEQWLLRISRALSGEFLDHSKPWNDFIGTSVPGSALHLIGLFSDGGVHSHRDHLKLLLSRLKRQWRGPVYLHLITDGRDTSPERALSEVTQLETVLKDFPSVKIATLIGRFFAMDRDKRWERTKKAYDLFVEGKGAEAPSPEGALAASYEKKITDEFIEPVVLQHAPIKPGDKVLFWNFREDRMRQIVAAICSDSFTGFERPVAPPDHSDVLCFTEYDHTLHLPYLFSQLETNNHLGEVLSAHGLKQLRVAETEKYPHVTYFFNAGIENPYPGEERKLVPSPRDVKTYDQKPEMSAVAVTDIVVEALRSKAYDFIVVNLANCDMVGHTGVVEAAVRAVETVDTCVGRMLDALGEVSGRAIIIADHGNAEQMINYVDGTPHTAHTTYPVPVIAVGTGAKSVRPDGALCDIAPTILDLVGIQPPPEMTGKTLLVR